MLFPIFFTLYFSLIFHIFEKKTKNLKILVSFLFFVDNRLFISQEKSFEKLNSILYYSYNIISSLLKHLKLVIKHRKSDIFHFSRSHGHFNPPLLDLSYFRGLLLVPKAIWKYFGFIFNKKLFFQQHIKYCTNKALSTVKCMKIIRNSTQGLLSIQKCILYRMCILPIVLYVFLLWYYNKAPLSFPLKELNKMQYWMVLWILDAFCTSPSSGIEAIAELTSIHPYLRKLSRRVQLRIASP